jgi:uncharacterized protein (DUF1800 family)
VKSRIESVSPARRRFASAAVGVCLPRWMAGCASTGTAAHRPLAASSKESVFRAVDRLSWGANGALMQEVGRAGFGAWLDGQLQPLADLPLPPGVEARIAALTISQGSLQERVWNLETQRKRSDAIASEDGRKEAQQSYQRELTRLAREAASRHLLRALYSPQQIREHMTWFWLNHFSVYQHKANLRALVGDYEDSAIRPHALGRFSDLLRATARHPAMLRYLDNEQNALNHLNENYARELLELHTLGVDGGYTQRDVQELARVLTGHGVNFGDTRPNLRSEWASFYVRDGAFEFNPNRHDFGSKTVLGQAVGSRGAAELDEVLGRLALHPATARFVSRKIALFLLTDEPPAALVDAMSRAFLDSGGDIATTLRACVGAPEFASPVARKFKDPMHYVVSAVRASYDGKIVINTGPMQDWLSRSGEGLYNRQTPDGYPLHEAAWTSSGQMTLRFELARTIGSGSAGLFKPAEGTAAVETPAFPQLASRLYYDVIADTLSASTRTALDHAATPQEWNVLMLSSPEFMYR